MIQLQFLIRTSSWLISKVNNSGIQKHLWYVSLHRLVFRLWYSESLWRNERTKVPISTWRISFFQWVAYINTFSVNAGHFQKLAGGKRKFSRWCLRQDWSCGLSAVLKFHCDYMYGIETRRQLLFFGFNCDGNVKGFWSRCRTISVAPRMKWSDSRCDLFKQTACTVHSVFSWGVCSMEISWSKCGYINGLKVSLARPSSTATID